MPQKISITVPVIGEEEALPIQERATCEAMQSSRIALSQMSSPCSNAPQPLDLALQHSAGEQSPRQEHMHADQSSKRTHSSLLRSMQPAQVKAKILPANYKFCDVDDLVVLVANMILELIRINDQLPHREGGHTRFHLKFAC